MTTTTNAVKLPPPNTVANLAAVVLRLGEAIDAIDELQGGIYAPSGIHLCPLNLAACREMLQEMLTPAALDLARAAG